MAKKYTVDLEVNTGKSDANIGDVVKAIKELNDAVVNGSKKSEESLEGLETTAKKSASGISKLGKIINNLAKAGGVIFLLQKAFDFFKEVASENQRVVDFFAITMETLSLAFNDLFKFIENNVGGVVDAFKAIFNDPLQAVKDLGNAIKDNIIERFNSALEVLGLLGSAAKKFFSGDFAGALEDAKSAGKEYIDVLTGVDDSFNKIGDAVSNAVEATGNYISETIKSAKSIVELNKAAAMSEVVLQGLIEKYDRQAELLRQIRDDETKTIAERQKANDDLLKVLELQSQKMLEQANNIEAAAQAQFDKNSNDANAIALQQAKNEKLGIEAQITGFISEQQSNANALSREAIELNQSKIDSEAELSIAKKQFQAEQILDEVTRIEALRQAAIEEQAIELKRLNDKKALYVEGTQAFQDAQNEINKFTQESNQNLDKIDDALVQSKKARTTKALGELAGIVGQNSKFGKGIALVQAIRDTYAGANVALASAPPPFNFISAAAVIAGGIANVKAITATKEPTPPSFARGAGGGGGSVSVPTPQVPSFNVVGTSGTNQLAESIAGQSKQPIKAYVVSSDVSTAQSLDRNIVEGASI